MNRRSFIRTFIGSTLTLTAIPAIALGNGIGEFDWEPREVKDLLLWAPYEAFLPDESNPVLSNPGEGTETGVLKAEAIVKGEPLTLDYWHGHGGVQHQFTVTKADLDSLKAGLTVVIYERTTVVGDHFHMVVIDPKKPA